jgi:hypothetical protein
MKNKRWDKRNYPTFYFAKTSRFYTFVSEIKVIAREYEA